MDEKKDANNAVVVALLGQISKNLSDINDTLISIEKRLEK